MRNVNAFWGHFCLTHYAVKLLISRLLSTLKNKNKNKLQFIGRMEMYENLTGGIKPYRRYFIRQFTKPISRRPTLKMVKYTLTFHCLFFQVTLQIRHGQRQTRLKLNTDHDHAKYERCCLNQCHRKRPYFYFLKLQKGEVNLRKTATKSILSVMLSVSYNIWTLNT